MSLLWGLRALALFGQDPKHPRWANFYQFTLNFVGSFAGWCCVYALAVRTSAAQPDLRSLTAGDFLLFFVSLLGVTGHAPQAMVRLMTGFKKLAAAPWKKVTG